MSHFPLRMASVLCVAVVAGHAVAQPRGPHNAMGRRIDSVAYEITFDSLLARSRHVRVAMSFDVATRGEVRLSLPAWTPGAYRISNFAQKVFISRRSPAANRWIGTKPITIPGEFKLLRGASVSASNLSRTRWTRL